MGNHGEGSWKDLGGGKWRYWVTAPDGRRPSITIHADTKKERLEKGRHFHARVWSGELTGTTHTVAELLELWLPQHQVSPSTRRLYQYVIDTHLSPGLGRTRLDKLTTYAIERFYAGIKPSAAEKSHTVLRLAFDQAMRWGWVARNPADAARVPRRETVEMRPPTVDQLAAIMAELDPEQALFVRLASVTGARRGELCALRWGQVDLARSTLTIESTMTLTADGYERGRTTKTKRGRSIAIDPDTLAALRSHRAERLAIRLDACKPGHYVFGTTLGQKPWNPQSVSHWFRRAARAAGFDGRLHDLRHFHATWMLQNGTSLADAATRLGHTQKTLVSVYSHAIPANDAGIAERAGMALRSAN